MTMNDPYTHTGQVGGGGFTGGSNAISEAPASTSFGAAIDQLRAVRQELVAAWCLFKYGSEPPTEQGGGGDRIDNMHDEIRILLNLAQEIRSRV